MDPIYNPYSPGGGRRPTRLVGRSRLTALWRKTIEASAAGTAAPTVSLTGLRGTGKTVMLGEMAAVARREGWIVAFRAAHAVGSLREGICEGFHAELVAQASGDPSPAMRHALRTTLSFYSRTLSAGEAWAFPVDLSGTEPSDAATGDLTADLTTLLRDLALATAERERGVALLVDDAQQLDPEDLHALCSAAEAARVEGWPLVIGLAGLPTLPPMLTRFQPCAGQTFAIEELQRMSPEQAREVLVAPAAAMGATYTDEALDLLVAEADGVPYLLQQLGQETWVLADGPEITADDARAGIERSHHVLDGGFYRLRWDMASPTEQRYLAMMAQDGDGGSSTTDVAARLGTTTKAIGTIRARLLQKGLLYTPTYGRVAYTVPGMARFVKRQGLDAAE